MLNGAIWIFLVVIIAVAIVVIAIVGMGKVREQRRFHRGVPLLRARATIVDARTAVTGISGQYAGATATQYFATFELPNGHRMELVVNSEVAGQIDVGDIGALQWQGTRFKGFQREIPR